MRVKFIDLNGCRTRYIHEGAGTPVLLLHGFGGSADNWCRNVDPLGRTLAVYAPDLLGFGFTAAVDLKGDPPHPHEVEHLTRFVDYLGLDQFAVVGQSFGALMAALLYLGMPHRISRLVLIGSASLLATEEELAEILPRSHVATLALMDNLSLDGCREQLARLVRNPTSIPEELLLLRLTAYARPEARAFYAAAHENMMDFDRVRPYRALDRLDQIAVPTLLLWGREDPLGPYARALEAVKRLPRGRLVTFEHCGHLPYLEQPEEFNRVVREFLEGG